MKGPSRPPRRHAPACVHEADKEGGAHGVMGGCETKTHTHTHCWNLMETEFLVFLLHQRSGWTRASRTEEGEHAANVRNDHGCVGVWVCV